MSFGHKGAGKQPLTCAHDVSPVINRTHKAAKGCINPLCQNHTSYGMFRRPVVTQSSRETASRSAYHITRHNYRLLPSEESKSCRRVQASLLGEHTRVVCVWMCGGHFQPETKCTDLAARLQSDYACPGKTLLCVAPRPGLWGDRIDIDLLPFSMRVWRSRTGVCAVSHWARLRLWSHSDPYQPDIEVASPVGVGATGDDVSSIRGLLY